jgi:translocator protein
LAETSEKLLRFGNIIAFIITLIINGAANTTLIGGRTTAEVSALYPTLITPAGYVFAIWGIIYFLLAVFLVYQILPSQQHNPFQKQISFLFILTCVFNVAWLFLWQNLYLAYSSILIVGYLLTLIAIYLRLNIGKSNVSLREKLAVQLPFSVYLGWVTIATIANISVTLVAANWDGFGLSLETWAVLVLVVALILDLIVIVTRRDIAYSLVFIWALVGIAVNQTNGNVVLTAEVAAIIIVVALAATLALQRVKRKPKQVNV